MNLLKVFEKCNLVHNVHTQKYEAPVEKRATVKVKSKMECQFK